MRITRLYRAAYPTACHVAVANFVNFADGFLENIFETTRLNSPRVQYNVICLDILLLAGGNIIDDNFRFVYSPDPVKGTIFHSDSLEPAGDVNELIVERKFRRNMWMWSDKSYLFGSLSNQPLADTRALDVGRAVRNDNFSASMLLTGKEEVVNRPHVGRIPSWHRRERNHLNAIIDGNRTSCDDDTVGLFFVNYKLDHVYGSTGTSL